MNVFLGLFADDLKGLEKVWIIGDNFLAETFRKHFKKVSHKFYMKMHYKVLPFCSRSSKYSDQNTNFLSRIINSFVLALNTKHYLPTFVIVVLDDDLIEHLNYKRFKVATLLGPWVEFLAEFFTEFCRTDACSCLEKQDWTILLKYIG